MSNQSTRAQLSAEASSHETATTRENPAAGRQAGGGSPNALPRSENALYGADKSGTPGPEVDPRQPFALDTIQFELIRAALPNGQDFINQSWSDLGARLGFVWTTVQDLCWKDAAGWAVDPEFQAPAQATFTAWPITPTEPDTSDALAWLEAHDGEPSSSADLYTRSNVLAAFNAGRDSGFAMGSACAQPNSEIGWDGMELIRESAERFREYEASHRCRISGAHADDRLRKAEHNATIAAKLEAFLGGLYT